MAGDGEIKKLKKDLQKNREEIADLQKRIKALIDKRGGGGEEKKSGSKSPEK
jgi:hypothetical protein